jgi:hypothetical protein
MKHIRKVTSKLDCSKEVFMMTYMDLNHIAPIHRGLNSWVDTSTARITYTAASSLQEVAFNGPAEKQGAYLEYYKLWMEHSGGYFPDYGAKWLCSYPYDMFENYPGMYVKSSLKHATIQTLEFFATTENIKLASAAIAAYMETADEDKIIVENLEWDRQNNLRPPIGTFHPILPSGVVHWKGWMANNPRPD